MRTWCSLSPPQLCGEVYFTVWMPEWSKGLVLSTNVVIRVGSNPTPDNIPELRFTHTSPHRCFFYFILYYNETPPNP